MFHIAKGVSNTFIAVKTMKYFTAIFQVSLIRLYINILDDFFEFTFFLQSLCCINVDYYQSLIYNWNLILALKHNPESFKRYRIDIFAVFSRFIIQWKSRSLVSKSWAYFNRSYLFINNVSRKAFMKFKISHHNRIETLCFLGLKCYRTNMLSNDDWGKEKDIEVIYQKMYEARWWHI